MWVHFFIRNNIIISLFYYLIILFNHTTLPEICLMSLWHYFEISRWCFVDSRHAIESIYNSIMKLTTFECFDNLLFLIKLFFISKILIAIAKVRNAFCVLWSQNMLLLFSKWFVWSIISNLHVQFNVLLARNHIRFREI